MFEDQSIDINGSNNRDFENQGVELEDEANKLRKRKRNLTSLVDDNRHITKLGKFYKRIISCLTEPSYLLITGSKNVRAENCVRLLALLWQLVRLHNWTEASGVLSVLLKATCKDRCPTTNRFKYLVSMELLERIESNHVNLATISGIYDAWMTRMGINLSSKKRRIGCSKEDGFVVRLESIIFSLMQGNVEGERHNARSLMQEHQFQNHPMFNLLVGLIFYQVWYSSIPEEMQWKDYNQDQTPTHSDMPASPLQSKMSDSRNSFEVGELDGHNAVFSATSASSFQYESETSVMNDKRTTIADDHLENDAKLQRENTQQDSGPQGFYAHSDENEASLDKDDGYEAFFSNLSLLKNLDSWLLPIRTEHWAMDWVIHDEDYKNAVKYLRQAVDSTPPVLEALLPLVQLLLIGGKDQEALNELEKFCGSSIAALPVRMKANLLRCIDPNNSNMLSTCFEDALKRDPTSHESLASLVSLHRTGDYDTVSLLDMIALHLDATFAGYSTWKEFASCFLKISLYEEDHMSVLLDGTEAKQKPRYSVRYNRVPKYFIHGKSGKAWRLRCKWWLNRHFNRSVLASEIAAGDLQLLTYKAACASQMYGQQFEYVGEVFSCLQKDDNNDLCRWLQEHVRNSIGIYVILQQQQQRSNHNRLF